VNIHQEQKMSKAQDRKKEVQQAIQEHKVKKNKYIIASVFWFLSSIYIYSNDSGFSDVYSLKPFIYFIVGPVFAAIIFGNIMFYLQKIIEKGVIGFLGKSAENLVLPVISFIFFCTLVAMFVAIFKFAELLQTII
tara:strand:+ start:3696 stop:4100 length:405 start_codon:yes stop_codon:yes gene_type:complete